MSKKIILFLVCLWGVWIPTVHAQSKTAPISIVAAQKLVEAAIYPNRSNAELDKMVNHYEADFAFFEAIDPNTKHGAHMGTYAVNLWTGDVWSTAGSCSRITSSKLTEMQKNIREHSALSAAEIETLSKKEPVCDAG